MPALDIGSEVQEELESQLCLQLPEKSASETSTVSGVYLPESIPDVQENQVQPLVEKLNLDFLSDDGELEISNDLENDTNGGTADDAIASKTECDEDGVIFDNDVRNQISQTVGHWLWADDTDSESDDDSQDEKQLFENNEKSQDQKLYVKQPSPICEESQNRLPEEENDDCTKSQTPSAPANYDEHGTNSDVKNLTTSDAPSGLSDAEDDVNGNNASPARMSPVPEEEEETRSDSLQNPLILVQSSKSETQSVVSLNSLWLESIADHDCTYQTLISHPVERLQLDLLSDDTPDETRDANHDPTDLCLTGTSPTTTDYPHEQDTVQIGELEVS